VQEKLLIVVGALAIEWEEEFSWSTEKWLSEAVPCGRGLEDCCSAEEDEDDGASIGREASIGTDRLTVRWGEVGAIPWFGRNVRLGGAGTSKEYWKAEALAALAACMAE
jgi:hypothetical protein